MDRRRRSLIRLQVGTWRNSFADKDQKGRDLQKFDRVEELICDQAGSCYNLRTFEEKKTECVVKTHDRSETFVLQGNIIIIHQSLLNSIFTTKLYILMKKINYEQR
jgi:hypothetical protein